MPIVATRDAEPPISAESLSPDALRRRFANPPAWTPEIRAEHGLSRLDVSPRLAAVLVPIIIHPGAPTVLLTRRNPQLSSHAGQVSFPGGGREPDDADETATALRESREEIGLDARHVEIIGTLPDYVTGTGFRIAPVVGLLSPPFELTADSREVDEIFEVPLEFLMDPVHHQVRLFEYNGGARRFYAMPYPRAGGGDYFVWGATAGMLRNLYHFLRA